MSLMKHQVCMCTVYDKFTYLLQVHFTPPMLSSYRYCCAFLLPVHVGIQSPDKLTKKQ